MVSFVPDNNPATPPSPQDRPGDQRARPRPGRHKWWRRRPQPPVLEAYWVERKRYLEKIKGIPELRRRYVQAMAIYLLRRFMWSFGFIPVFLGFWLPLVFSRFNPVAMVDSALPQLRAFVEATPQIQSNTLDTLLIAWLSVGLIFALFDLVLTPFKSPYQYEADVHMRAWEELQNDAMQWQQAETRDMDTAPESPLSRRSPQPETESDRD